VDWQSAKEIIRKKKLISSEVSKKILFAVRNQRKVDLTLLPKEISPTKIKQLQKLYNKRVTENQDQQDCPRNSIFYNIIKSKIPTFSWEIRGKNVVFNVPKIANLEPSLLSLLLLDIEFDNNYIEHRYSTLKELPKNVSDEVIQLFEKIKIIYPDKENMQRIVKWLDAGLRGETLYTFSLACPDYSVEPTGDPRYPFRHTFSEVHSGIGLIARRILDAIPIIKHSFAKFNIDFIPILAMADYEILSEANLKILKITSDEFLKRMESSRNSFKKDCSIPIVTPHVTELCGGYEKWKEIHSYFKDQFQKNDFGAGKINEKKITEILKSRKLLYARWYGFKEKIEEYLPILLEQGAEYATVGEIVAFTYKNCLILGADHSVFAEFYNINQSIPLLYLKRFYR
jgi:hypothetical protein